MMVINFLFYSNELRNCAFALFNSIQSTLIKEGNDITEFTYNLAALNYKIKIVKKKYKNNKLRL